MFIGRIEQLEKLNRMLDGVRQSKSSTPGKALLIRGRRRVGKSRLVEELLQQADIPHVFFTATGRPVRDELKLFAEEVSASSLPNAALFENAEFSSWDAAFALLATAIPAEGCVIVFDEMPYLVLQDPGFEGSLQKAFDRTLSKQRVLFVGVGSDLAMMEKLNTYGRPFYQRATEFVIPPLSPKEVSEMLGFNAVDSFDAYLITGGLPLILAEWPTGATTWEYLEEALNDATSALLVSGERVLAAEFAEEMQARTVLSAIGDNQRTFRNIGQAAGDMAGTSLTRSLKLLEHKRLVQFERPYSVQSSRRLTQYRIADSYLRFWLAFLESGLSEIERGRGDRVLARIRKSWPSWRGQAIEPVLREGLDRSLLGSALIPDSATSYVGSWWTRDYAHEIDIVVGDSMPTAKKILAVGSIKWREKAPFGQRDLAELYRHLPKLPGFTDEIPVIAVSRNGVEVGGVHEVTPEELLW